MFVRRVSSEVHVVRLTNILSGIPTYLGAALPTRLAGPLTRKTLTKPEAVPDQTQPATTKSIKPMTRVEIIEATTATASDVPSRKVRMATPLPARTSRGVPLWLAITVPSTTSPVRMTSRAYVCPVNMARVIAFSVHVVSRRSLTTTTTSGVHVQARSVLAIRTRLNKEQVRGLQVVQVELAENLWRRKKPTFRLGGVDHVALRPRPRIASPSRPVVIETASPVETSRTGLATQLRPAISQQRGRLILTNLPKVTVLASPMTSELL